MFAIWNRMQAPGLGERAAHRPRRSPAIGLSFIDNVVIPVAVPRRVRFLAKSDDSTGKGLQGAWYRFFFSSGGAVPLPRSTHSDAQAALDIARGFVERGEAFRSTPDQGVCVPRSTVAAPGWPGSRSRPGGLIVPVGLKGTQKTQPIGARPLYPRKISVTFGGKRCGSVMWRIWSAPCPTAASCHGPDEPLPQEETGVYNTPPPADS